MWAINKLALLARDCFQRHDIRYAKISWQRKAISFLPLYFLCTRAEANSKLFLWPRSATSAVNQIIVIISPSGCFATIYIYKKASIIASISQARSKYKQKRRHRRQIIFNCRFTKSRPIKVPPISIGIAQVSQNTLSSVCATSPRTLCFNFTPVDMRLSDAGYPSFTNWWWSRGEIARGLSVRSQMN